MRTTRLVIMLAFAPVALLAQASGGTAAVKDTTKGMASVAKGHGQAVSTAAKDTGSASSAAKGHGQAVSAAAHADARADVQLKAPKSWSADGSAKLEAMYAEARKESLPPEPMAKRVSEGSAKGASETTILASAGKVKANMEATQHAMVKAGRKPSGEETERGGMAMEHGVTEAQIETMAEHTPSDRSLVVAFDVLGKLTARGVPVAQALAEIQAKIDARASDQAIIALGNRGGASANGTGSGSANPGGAAAGTSATGAVTGTAKGVSGSVTGAVTGVVKKP